MKFKVKKIIATATTKICKLSAESVSASACLSGYFQPREPKSLKKDQ
ncbi:cyclic lactone autoinducer peptide [Clostridium beijerinckii]|nr:cyclic lactone autoinducer peptide [Clostridium beijerinckii]